MKRLILATLVAAVAGYVVGRQYPPQPYYRTEMIVCPRACDGWRILVFDLRTGTLARWYDVSSTKTIPEPVVGEPPIGRCARIDSRIESKSD